MSQAEVGQMSNLARERIGQINIGQIKVKAF
jgi:hypothetical protein